MYNPLLETASTSANATELSLVPAASSPITPSQPLTANLSPSISGSAGSPHCRYCLGRNQSLNYSEDRESLIGPCRCKGTMGLVHPGCLTRWLQVSRKYRCELCGFDLRQCERLGLEPDDAGDSVDVSPTRRGPTGAATGAGDEAAELLTEAAVGEVTEPVPASLSEWLRLPEQACCIAMTACCLLLVSPMIGVLVYFLTELRRQTRDGSKSASQQDYQVVLFELLTGFVSVAVVIWLVYGSVTCAYRYRAWRWALQGHREATAIVSLSEETSVPV